MQNMTMDRPSRFINVPSDVFSYNKRRILLYCRYIVDILSIHCKYIVMKLQGSVTLYSSFRLKNAFSVMPMSAVAQARTKIARPVKVWTGRKAARRCEARPGHRKVTRPRLHWATATQIVRRPHHAWRLRRYRV